MFIVKNKTFSGIADSNLIHSKIIILNISDHMDVKGWSSFFDSAKALDVETRKRAIQDFRDCEYLINKITFILNSAIRCIITFDTQL